MLQNLAREFKGAGHDSHLACAVEHGIADVDHELNELLRRSDGVVDHAAIARQIHHFGELLRSPEFGRTITGLPDHLARSAARDVQAHEPDLAQLGTGALDATTERIIEMFEAAASKVDLVGVTRIGYNIARSEHPYKEALRQALALAPEIALPTTLALICPLALPVALGVTIAVHFIVGDELIYRHVSLVVADHLDHWARKRGLVRRFDRELGNHHLLCALGRTVRDTSRDLHHEIGRAERQVTNALRPHH